MADADYSRRTYLKWAAGASAIGMAGLAGCTGGNSGSNGSNGSSGNGSSGNSSSGSGGSGSDAALEVLHGWTGGDGADAINKLTTMFKNQHPNVSANFRAIGGGGNVNLNSRVAQRLANNDPPSSFAGWPGANLVQYDGVLMDISSVWKQAGLTDAIVNPAAKASKFNGKYVTVPIGSHRLNNLYYNEQIVEEANVDPSSISDMDSFVSALKKVQQNTDKTPLSKGMKSPFLGIQFWVEVFLSQSGKDAYTKFTKGNGDKAKVKKSLKTTKSILTNYINQDASTIGYTEAAQSIINGDAAFMHNGNWVAGMFRAAEGFDFNDAWGWQAFPGTENMYVFHLDSFIAPSNNPSPQATKTWEKFVGSKQAQVQYNKRKGSVPVRTDIDGNKLGEYLKITYNDLVNAQDMPRTLAHGLAVPPETLGNVKTAFGNNFMGPYKVDAAADALMQAVQGQS